MRRFGLRLIMESKRGLQGVQTLQAGPKLEIRTPKLKSRICNFDKIDIWTF